MLPKNLKITELISQAEFVIRLQFIAVVRSTDALQIFTPIRIPGPQSPDEPSWIDMIYLAGCFRALEIDLIYLKVELGEPTRKRNKG